MADEENNKHDHWPFWGGIGLFVLIVGFYSINIEGSLSTDTDDWGTFGDYVGGLANPVIALIVLYYVYRSFKIQKTELKETRKEFKKSRETQEKQTKFQSINNRAYLLQCKITWLNQNIKSTDDILNRESDAFIRLNEEFKDEENIDKRILILTDIQNSLEYRKSFMEIRKNTDLEVRELLDKFENIMDDLELEI